MKPPAPRMPADPARRRAFALGVLAILATGAALRLWRLGEAPFGFHTDEGHYAMDGWRILQGARPVFLERNNGREPLFVYLMAGLFALLGPSIQTARLTAALSGLLAILAQVLWVGALPLPRPRRAALISGAYLALSFWPVAQGRYALRTGLMPAWVALMLWAWWRAVAPRSDEETGPSRPARTGHAALAGLFLAAGLYTYLTGRLLPAALVGSAAWIGLVERERRVWRPLALALGLAGILALPLADYYRRHPDMVSHRTAQVSILSPEVNDGHPVAALAENGWRLAQMPLGRGDGSWYHNLRRRPVFDDWPAKLAFLAGMAVLALMLAGRRGREARAAAVLVALAGVVTVLPSWLSQGAPNYVRLTGVWPLLFLPPALGLDALAAAWESRFPRARHGATAAIIVALAWTGLGTARAYFRDYAPRPEVYEAFNGAAVERATALAALPRPLYLSPALRRQSVVEFVNLPAGPVGAFVPGMGLVLPAEPRDAGARYAFDPVEAQEAEAFGALWTDAERQAFAAPVGLGLAGAGPPPPHPPENLVVFSLDAAALRGILQGLDPAAADFGGQIVLEGVRLGRSRLAAGGTVPLRLAWRRGDWPQDGIDRSFFVHVVDAAGRGLAQVDGPPLGLAEGGSAYPTNAWKAGEVIVQDLTLTIAADAAPGPARVLHGWYDWRDGRRLELAGGEDGAAEVGRLDVSPPPGAGAGG